MHSQVIAPVQPHPLQDAPRRLDLGESAAEALNPSWEESDKCRDTSPSSLVLVHAQVCPWKALSGLSPSLGLQQSSLLLRASIDRITTYFFTS